MTTSKVPPLEQARTDGRLRDIVQDRDLPALEAYCLRRRKHRLVRLDAEAQEIDLDELEDLLAKI